MNRMFLLVSTVPHLFLTALLAMTIAGIAALLGNRSRRERLYHAGWLFTGCMAGVVAGSWLMYLVHG
jgi:hypothetical protein